MICDVSPGHRTERIRMALAQRPWPKRLIKRVEKQVHLCLTFSGQDYSKNTERWLTLTVRPRLCPIALLDVQQLPVINVRPDAAYAWKSARLRPFPWTDAVKMDIGACLFCGECAAACPNRAIRFTSEYSMAVTRRGGFDHGATGQLRQSRPGTKNKGTIRQIP